MKQNLFSSLKKENLCSTALKLINWNQRIIINTCDSNNYAFKTVHTAFRGLSRSILGGRERFTIPVAIAEVCLSWQGLHLSFDRKLGDACLQPYWEELLSAVGVFFYSVSGAKPAGRCDTNGRFHFCSSLEAEQGGEKKPPKNNEWEAERRVE